MWLALLLFGCPTEGQLSDPSPYVYDDDEPPAPSLDTPALEAAMQEFVDNVRSYDAEPVIAAYGEVVATADAYCPPYYSDVNGTYWYGACTSEAGTEFNGYGFAVVYDDVPLNGYIADAQGVFGVATMATAGGDVLGVSGTAYWLDGTSTGEGEAHMLYQTVLQGTFDWTGLSGEGTWLSDASTPDLSLTALRALVTPDARYLAIDGGVTGLASFADTVVAEQIVIFTTAVGSTCPSEPSGSLAVRGPDGNWFDVLFDGPSESNGYVTPPADCDGCGRVYWRGEDLGPACVDFTPLLDWQERPW